jgi:hypothetical protein
MTDAPQPSKIAIEPEDVDALRWIAASHAVETADLIIDELSSSQPDDRVNSEKFRVWATSISVCAELLDSAEQLSVDASRVPCVLETLRLGRGIALRQIDRINALMERLGDDPHAAPYAGGDA